MDDGKKFLRLSIDDIDLGRPLRWPIYNGNRVQILPAGAVLETQAKAEEIFRNSVYRWILKDEVRAPPPKPAPTPSPITLQATTPVPVPAPEPVPAPAAPREERSGRIAEIRRLTTDAPPRQNRQVEVSFESSRLQVGEPIHLQTLGENPQRYVVRLIGYAINQGIIVSAPEDNGALVMVREGQGFVGRFFSGHSAYGFSTVVSRITSLPFPHVHLTYPRQISVQEVRKSPRVPIDLIVALSLPNAAGEAAGRLVDLSTHGASLRTRTKISEKGESLVVKFKLVVHGIEMVLALPAEVCNVTHHEGNSAMPFAYGLRFTDIDHSAQFALTAYVYGRLLGH